MSATGTMASGSIKRAPSTDCSASRLCGGIFSIPSAISLYSKGESVVSQEREPHIIHLLLVWIKKQPPSRGVFLVRPPGVEPGTVGLKGHCSTIELWARVGSKLQLSCSPF